MVQWKKDPGAAQLPASERLQVETCRLGLHGGQKKESIYFAVVARPAPCGKCDGKVIMP